MSRNRPCIYVTVAVAVASWLCATLLGWTAQEHEVLIRTQGRGEDLSPDFRGIPTAPEGTASYVRSKVSNLWLHRQVWEPEGDAKAVVVFAHGYAEYSGRFLVVPEALTKAGIAVAMQDFEGHGRSEGDRVFTPKFSRLVQYFAGLVRDMRKAHPGLPVVCAGQSMGSLVAGLAAESDAAVANKADALCDGLVVMGLASQGAMERNVRKMPFILNAVELLSTFLPQMPLSRLNTLDELSTDEAEYTSWGNDPFCTTVPLHARMGTQMLHAQLAVADNAQNITVPLLVLHGTDDTIALPGGPRQLYEAASTPAEDKKIVMYEGSRHCVLMEPRFRQKALDEFSTFVLTKVAKSSPPSPSS